jgi:formin 2
MNSKHLDSQIVRDTLIGFDSQILNDETLNSIYSIRPQDDEIRSIQDYLKSPNNSGEELLDKPEFFLLELSRITAFEERIYCLVYQNKFRESISSIEFRLNNISTICDELITSEKIKKILGIVLACGNNMNATNKQRCDADGFDLAILPNLKDVKSKDNTTNLLQYIAYYYVNKIDNTEITKFPLPDPSDISFVSQASFDELEKELKRVRNELKDIEQRVEKVLIKQAQQDETLIEPFKSKINEFLKNAINECQEQEDSYTKCKLKFTKLAVSYCMKPKGADSEVTLNYFFSIWATFILDFKEAWKKESQKLSKQRY